MKQRAGVLAVTAALVAMAPGTASAEGHRPMPGAPGIGDPYFPLDGNGGYDVGNYDLDLRYDPASDRLSGVATITARANQDLSRFNLDFEGLQIRTVSVDRERARWSREGGELTIRPQEPIGAGQHVTVRISYAGVPQTIEDPLIGVSGFIHTDDGALVAGEPDAAATWFPANDHPRDAATFDIDITVPEGLQALSNGVLAGRHTDDGWTTWSWRPEEKMATYLTTLAIGHFDLRKYEEDGIRFWDALDPDLSSFVLDPENPDAPSVGEIAEASLAREPEIIDFLEEFAGPYPFEASGGIVDDFQLQFALETQTRPVYSPFFFTDAFSGDIVLVHELSHMWFGDDVRVRAWRHIWLNEGPATYMEWLWLERQGVVTAQEIFDGLAGIPAEEEGFWGVKTGDPGPEDLFDTPAVYLRGGMTLHALRMEVGDDVFFRILENWAQQRSGTAASTPEFIALAERESGRQLDELFRTWLFTSGKPAGLPDEPPPPPGAAAERASEGILAKLTDSSPRR
jgi:aminopeptidase N